LKRVKIYGERNTATNYLESLINLNLNVTSLSGVVPSKINRLQHILPGNEWLKDIYFFFTYKDNLGWKHTKVKTKEELKKYKIVDDNLVFITLTKNPYSWLLSLYKKPYHQLEVKRLSFEEFLNRKWRVVGRENIKIEVKNPMELWNIKNRAYLNLPKKNTLNLKTEDLIANPKEIIEAISIKYNIPKKNKEFINLIDSTKEKDKDFNFYQDYYSNERWKKNLSRDNIEMINCYLDKELMRYFNYKIL